MSLAPPLPGIGAVGNPSGGVWVNCGPAQLTLSQLIAVKLITFCPF